MTTFCSYFNQDICRSCDLITLDYPAQIQRKESALREALKDIEHPEFLTTVVSHGQHFRNKAKFVVTGSLENPIIGLWGEENLDQGRELLNCPLHLKEINDILPSLKPFIQAAKLVPYQIASKTGELKGIILFHSESTNESYLRFILRSKESIDRIKKHARSLQDQFPNIKCISVNIQPIAHAVLEGEEEIFITENKSITHKAGNVLFSLGPRAFVQTNQFVAEKLYSTAASWVKESNLHRFMELFCGQGAFSFFCAPFIKEGLGIEINPEAVEVANLTAKKFNLTHLKFKAADAGKVQNEIENFSPEFVLVNPPRRGLAGAVELLLRARPKRIIYSSCNYETLASDLCLLSKEYSISKIQIFDMFPHTTHFETLVELISDD